MGRAPILFRDIGSLQSCSLPWRLQRPRPRSCSTATPLVACIRGATDSSVIDTAPCGEGRGSICRGGRVICQQLCLLSVGGNTLLESAGHGVWVGTPVTTDSSTGADRPSAVRPIVSPPRELIAGSREWKKPIHVREF